MHHLMISCAFWGNGYARIHRDKDFRHIRLQLLHPVKVELILNSNEELFYRLDNGELSWALQGRGVLQEQIF